MCGHLLFIIASYKVEATPHNSDKVEDEPITEVFWFSMGNWNFLDIVERVDRVSHAIAFWIKEHFMLGKFFEKLFGLCHLVIDVNDNL